MDRMEISLLIHSSQESRLAVRGIQFLLFLHELSWLAELNTETFHSPELKSSPNLRLGNLCCFVSLGLESIDFEGTQLSMTLENSIPFSTMKRAAFLVIFLVIFVVIKAWVP